MTDHKIEISPQAEQELIIICGRISVDNGAKVALKHKRRIKNHINLLKKTPYIGEEIGRGYRKLSVPPWIVAYRVEEDCVKIVRIFDGRQDWQKILFALHSSP